MNLLDGLINNSNYMFSIVIFVFGLYLTASSGNLFKKLFGCLIFQAAILLFLISVGKIDGSRSPILVDDPSAIYANPLPQVLVLTAIVVGIATLSVGIALVIRIKKGYGNAEEYKPH